MKITLAGTPGSGKSTVSRYLEKRFKLKRYNMGEVRRRMAAERGMTLAELNRLGEKESWTDEQADEYQRTLAKEEDFVMDSRLGWFFIPDSIKIFLRVDERIGAKRIFLEQRGKERGEKKWESIGEVERANGERMKSDIKRYKKLYDVNPYNIGNYDIILDTSDMTMEETQKAVERAILKFI